MKKLLLVLTVISAVAAAGVVLKRKFDETEELPHELPDELDLH